MAYFYRMGSAHRLDKSGEPLSKHPFPTLGTSISGYGSTLTHIPIDI